MKIAYIIGGLPFGGVENWLLDLTRSLKNNPDFEVHVINVSGTGNLMEKYLEHGIDVIAIGKDKQSINTHRVDTLFKLRSVLKRLDVDIIHTLHFSGDYFGRLAAIGLGVPVITHIRNVKTEKKARRRFINKALSFVTTMYLSVSKAAATTIAREHNIAGRPVQVLYNAVNQAKLDVPPIDLQKKHGITGKTIIGVGRLVEQKNFDKLIKALAIVKKEIPGVSLVILGDGSLMQSLQELRKKLQLEDSVFLEGYVPNENVPRYLHAAHILAMPSDYEGLPVTHVEALFCGLPAIISEFVPSIEIARDSSLVCKTEIEDIADKLRVVLSDDQLYAKMSAAALKAAPEFSMDHYLEKLKRVYQDLL